MARFRVMGNAELLNKVCKVSVKEDEKTLEICCTALPTILH